MLRRKKERKKLRKKTRNRFCCGDLEARGSGYLMVGAAKLDLTLWLKLKLKIFKNENIIILPIAFLSHFQGFSI